MKVLSKRLGHSSYQLTTDTYTHVLPQLRAAEAEAVVSVAPFAPSEHVTLRDLPRASGGLPSGNAGMARARLGQRRRPGGRYARVARVAARRRGYLR
jgi:hypothetical protein